MAIKLVGCFYFSKSVNGNLLGEFTNDKSDDVTPECGVPTIHASGFVGTYKTVWFDIEQHFATLEITQKPNTNIYILEWTETGKPSYSGQAMLVENKLVGHYKQS